MTQAKVNESVNLSDFYQHGSLCGIPIMAYGLDDEQFGILILIPLNPLVKN